jgi:hypothetical protein
LNQLANWTQKLAMSLHGAVGQRQTAAATAFNKGIMVKTRVDDSDIWRKKTLHRAAIRETLEALQIQLLELFDDEEAADAKRLELYLSGKSIVPNELKIATNPGILPLQSVYGTLCVDVSDLIRLLHQRMKLITTFDNLSLEKDSALAIELCRINRQDPIMHSQCNAKTFIVEHKFFLDRTHLILILTYLISISHRM